MATTYDLTLYEGESKMITVSLSSEGIPVDLAGANIKYVAGDIIEKTVGNGITIMDAASGVFQLVINPIDTIGHAGSSCQHDCSVRLHGRLVRMDDCGVTLESGDIVAVFYGNLTVMYGIIK